VNGPIDNSYWVVPDKLLAGKYPGAIDARDSRKKLTAIVDAGIRSFVDLTERHELERYDDGLRSLARERTLDLRYARFPIVDVSTPTPDEMTRIVEHVSSEIAVGRPVYVHCRGGIGRTGTVVGCWMVQEEGRRPDDALARIADLRSGLPGISPETDDQCAFVREWGGSTRATAGERRT